MKKEKPKLKNSEITEHIKRLFFFLRESGVHFGYLALSVVLSLGFTLLTLYSVSLLKPLAEGIIKGSFDHVKNIAIIGKIVGAYPGVFSTSTMLFAFLIVWVYGVIIAKNVLYYFSFLSTQYQSKLSTVRLRDLMLKKCLSYEKSFYDQNSISFLRRLLTQSTGVFENQFGILQKLFIQLSLLIVYTILMLRISWKLTLISFIVFPILNLMTKLVVGRIKDASVLYNEMSDKLDERIFNILYCIPVIKGFAQEAREMKLFAEASKDEVEQSFKIQKLTTLIDPIEDLSVTTGILLVAIGMATLIHVDTSIAASSAFVFFYLAMKIIPTFNAVNNFKTKAAGAAGAIRDIEYILHRSDHFNIEQGTEEFTGLKKGIDVKNLTFSFDGSEKPVLDDVSCFVEAGKVTAVVGPSGSGKTTLFNILLRFYDCPENSIFLDGEDVRKYTIPSVRSHMSFVGQESLMFNDTIMHNIQYARHTPMEEGALNEMSKNVRVEDIVGRMPEGYETMVGERGSRLSGGEKQRVSIARALAKDPEIIFFDEATSALDSRTEEGISNFLYQAYAGKTMFIIAHRLSTIKRADKVIYIEKGKVVEQGTFDELLTLRGHFYKQWEAQRI